MRETCNRRRRQPWWALAVLFCLISLANAEESPASREPPKNVPVHTGDSAAALAKGRVVQGRVVFADTRQPVRRAPVTLFTVFGPNQQDSRTATDDDGRFRVTGIPRGDRMDFRLRVTMPRESAYLGFEVDVRLVGMTTEQNIALLRGIPVTGVVVDGQTGRGVEGMYITWWNIWVQGDPPGWWNPHDAVTDREGRFRMSLPPRRGTVAVSGSVPGQVLGFGDSSPPLSGERYVGQRDASGYFLPAPQDVTVPTGRGLPPLRFELGRGLTLRGRVMTAEGAPVAMARVMEYSGGLSPTMTTSDESGAFVLTGVVNEPGRFILACHEELKLKSLTRVPTTQPGEKRRDIPLDIVVRPVATIKGRLVTNGKPTPDAEPELYEWVPGVVFGKAQDTWRKVPFAYGIPAGAGLSNSVDLPLTSRCTIDADGNWSFHNLVSAWKYDVTLEANGHESLHMPTVQLKPGEVRDVGAIELCRLRTIRVTIVDADGRPIPGVNVNRLHIEPSTGNVPERFDNAEARAASADNPPRPPSPAEARFAIIRGTLYALSDPSDKNGVMALHRLPDTLLALEPWLDEEMQNVRILNQASTIKVPAGQTEAKIVLKFKPSR